VSSSPRVRTHLRINILDVQNTTFGLSHNAFFNAIYLWSVFFKIDGATVSVNSSLKLQGKATVIPTPGDHGDIPGLAQSDYPGGRTQIPPSLGDFVTTLEPIPVTGTGFTAGGVAGFVEILLQQRDTPDQDVGPGHQAMNNALQQGLNSLIPTLGFTNQNVTQQDIQNIENQVSSAVTAAIKNALGVGYKLLTFLTIDSQDVLMGNAVSYYTASQLAASPPKGIAISDLIAFPAAPDPTSVNLTFEGSIVADPFPLSLRRIMTGMGHAPPVGVRSVMGSPITPSLLAWVEKVR
jgi:hypothetical protein